MIEIAVPDQSADEHTTPAPEEDLAVEDLIEEVSIDGMCGVY